MRRGVQRRSPEVRPKSTRSTTESEPAAQPDKLTGPAPGDRVVHNLTGFISPSGNVSCMIDADWARCDIMDRDWSPPARPADCELGYGQGISLAPGERADFVCAGEQPSARMRCCRTASRSPPGCCDAKVPRRASRAEIWKPRTGSRFHGGRIGCFDLAGSEDRRDLCGYTLVDYRRPSRRATCRSWRADVAQLVAHHLAKVRVAGSNPVIRSKVQWHQPQRWSGRVVRQRPAKPCTRVRFPSPPPRRIPRD